MASLEAFGEDMLYQTRKFDQSKKLKRSRVSFDGGRRDFDFHQRGAIIYRQVLRIGIC